MLETPTLNIIGAGHLGQTMGKLWAESQCVQIAHVLNRTPQSTQAAIAFIGAGHSATDIATLPPADITLIATPDAHIADCCAELAASGTLNARSIVFHCSGALGSSVLSAAAAQGAAVASIHPVRSFAQPAQTAAHFSGTLCGVEGDARALDMLARCFDAIGASFVPIAAEHKVLYHAAAVFACNYLVTLQDIAQTTYGKAGIAPETALRLMEPLVRETIDNIFSKGPAQALSGPIARGDFATVDKQQQALALWRPDYAGLYQAFASLTTALAARHRDS
jgi:predicted short-subunit dehydrogenase-like oxidoreductase (DUF2520 family)